MEKYTRIKRIKMTQENIYIEKDGKYKLVYEMLDKQRHEFCETARKRYLTLTVMTGIGLSALTFNQWSKYQEIKQSSSYIRHQAIQNELNSMNLKNDADLESLILKKEELKIIESHAEYKRFESQRNNFLGTAISTVLGLLILSGITLQQKLNKDKYRKFLHTESPEGIKIDGNQKAIIEKSKDNNYLKQSWY